MAAPDNVSASDPVLGVIIPAYNEARSIEQIIRRVLRESCVQQVVVVDDCSSDGTTEIAKRCAGAHHRLSVLRHQTNLGKGAAVRTGLAAITLVLIQDADLEYDPADYQKLISPIIRGRASGEPIAPRSDRED
ncbi:MAG: glycosyltransferase family 2 protein [Candidatus Dormibacterales bacterium]